MCTAREAPFSLKWEYAATVNKRYEMGRLNLTMSNLMGSGGV
jgi:hypothetical protein